MDTIYFELGEFPESLKLAQVSLNISNMPNTKILLCRHYLSKGNLIEVKKILSEILRKEPNNPQVILLNQRVEHTSVGGNQPQNSKKFNTII